MVLVISADEIKKTLPDYSPDKAEVFHTESARQADKLLTQALKEGTFKEVILLNGGTASGKTEFLSTHLMKKRAIIFDATLATQLGAQNKIRQIQKAKKTPVVYSVIPDDLRRAFKAFLNRDRKFSDTHFYKTHSGSRKTLLWIAKNYPELAIHIVESSYTSDQKLHFDQIQFTTRTYLVKYLIGKQQEENDIISSVNFIK